MRSIVRNIVEERLGKIRAELGVDAAPYFEIEKPKKSEFGDFSTNAAMVIAKAFRKNPRDVAARFVEGFSSPFFAKTDIAGPGFINFFLDRGYVLRHLGEVARDFGGFLSPAAVVKKKVMLEYVSANPTGPLHVGHGRGACIGSSLALILGALGHDVQQEFYVNDAGAQVRNLGLSIILRAREQQGETVAFPDGCYLGEYVSELAAAYRAAGGDTACTDENIEEASRFGRAAVTGWIEKDLADFGVRFDTYRSERAMIAEGGVDEALRFLKDRGLAYEADGALWFKSSVYGDDKDRVLVKENGERTYFASDVAYHREKFEKQFDGYVNIWGADHHGYVPRIKSALKAMGYDEKRLGILMVQMVSLFRDGRPVTMSKRAGDFVTLREVLDEVGKDAMRFMFLTRKHDSPLDFDIDLVKQKTSDNPVFYVQYMYARINSVFAVAAERGIDAESAPLDFSGLDLPEERALIDMILSFPDVVVDAGEHMEPHILSFYLIGMAQSFHAYYNAHRFINEDDPGLTRSRLNLLKMLKALVGRGLALLGIESPERM